MTTRLDTLWQWALRYTGDPDSWGPRGSVILDFLREEGLKPHHHVLEHGCGNLSQGRPLIGYLDEGRYVGIEPNGWLVEIAMERYPELAKRNPRFLWRDDFDASEVDRRFDFIVSHSVLSHAAHWQMEMLLARTREVAADGAVMLASLRLGEQNSFAQQWQYPGVSFFRIDTLRVLGFHAGWHVEHLPDLRHRLAATCRNDFHDWVRFTAMPSAEEQNRLRMAEQARQYDEQQLADATREVLREWEQQRVDELAAAAEAEQ